MARIKPQALLQQSKKKKGPSSRRVPAVVACNIITVLVLLLVLVLYRNSSARTSINSAKTDARSDEDLGVFAGDNTKSIPKKAILNTTKGIITIELFGQSSGAVVWKFVERSQHGYFNGLQFYRVIKHIVIQGGDPNLAGAREDWTNGGELTSQLHNSPKHEAFMVGTSKPDNQKENFELYITTAPIPDLNAKIAVFGHVIKGVEVVQEIEEVDTDEHFRPKSPVTINDVSFKDEL